MEQILLEEYKEALCRHFASDFRGRLSAPQTFRISFGFYESCFRDFDVPNKGALCHAVTEADATALQIRSLLYKHILTHAVLPDLLLDCPRKTPGEVEERIVQALQQCNFVFAGVRYVPCMERTEKYRQLPCYIGLEFGGERMDVKIYFTLEKLDILPVSS